MQNMDYTYLTRMDNEVDHQLLLSRLESEGIEYYVHNLSHNADEYLKIIGVHAAADNEIYVKREQYDMAFSILQHFVANSRLQPSDAVKVTRIQRACGIILLIFVILGVLISVL